MRYNKDTERGISLDAIAEQCRNAIKDLPQSAPCPVVWSPRHLSYISNPELVTIPV